MAIVYPQISSSADLLKSTIRLDELFPFLQKQGTEAVALVNTRLYGVLPFWEAAQKTGIHAVLGLSSSLEMEGEVCPVVLYAKNDKGYQNLLKLTSAIATRDRETIPEKWAEAYREGIICAVQLTPDLSAAAYEQALERTKEIYGDSCFGAVRRPEGKREESEDAFVACCQNFGIPVMATQEARYMKAEDAFAFEVASAIGQGVKLTDENRRRPAPGLFVPTAEEFKDWFSDRPDWLQETAHLLSACRVSIPTGRQLLPVFPLPEGTDAAAYLKKQCETGLKERGVDGLPAYEDRLRYELAMIGKMGYIDYFLIVADFMHYAKERGILTGPGRGSSAGSLVAYSLQITDVDPLAHGLLFERFLNPERVTLPDIDIDFADYRRHEVIEYVAKKYGEQHTAQIITFGTLSAKAVARDTARVFGFAPEELEAISSMIPNRIGITLSEAYNSSPKLRSWIGESERRDRWFNTARSLEGLPRHASTHAAGVILSPDPLVDHVPIEKGAEGIFSTQWPMDDLEKVGLLKMDFLGLRNLTILERIRILLYRETKKWIDYRKLPLGDEQTFALLTKGDTAGVFQLESEGMRRALQLIRPNAFGDIVAVNALFRPGPMEFIPLYARRKHGEEPVRYLHPELESILGETYGVIVYQEQIMQIAAKMAGFSLGEADLLRRAVSKKKREVLDEERAHFVSGALGKGFAESVANAVYDLIVRFADYGFPKSHAVAYSMISYQLAYMKAHFPACFYAALLANNAGNAEKTKQFIQEIKDKEIPVLGPSVQDSHSSFSVQDGSIRFGLSAVKGVPGTAVKKLIESRKEGAFRNLFDVAERISAIHFKRKAMEPLIKAGAFDCFGVDRAVLLASLDAAVKHAELVKPNEEPGLFDELGGSFMKPKYTEASPMPEGIRLEFEKEALGFYLSVHPMEQEKERRGKTYASLNALASYRNGQSVRVIGMLEEIKRIRTKKGEAMAFLTIQDETGMVSVTLFPKEYAAFNAQLQEQAILEIEGTIEHRNQKVSLICKALTS